MQTPDISVIMPCFNSAPWLGQAIESVRVQQGVDWELILVDDHSTDASLERARQYAARDARLRVLENEGEKGSAGCRNTGMRAARGKALFFLDSDDAIYPDALRSLLEALQRHQAPAVRGEIVIFCHQRWLAMPPRVLDGPQEVVPTDYPRHHFAAHLYRADFLHEHGIMFPEHLIIGQDTAFLCHVYALLDSLPALRAPVYLYRINHKPSRPAAVKAIAFANRLLFAREVFEAHGKAAVAREYLRSAFFREWLERAHAARSQSQDAAHEYLALCARLFSGIATHYQADFFAALGQYTPLFLKALEEGDAPAMLQLIESAQALVPTPVYMGINMAPRGMRWELYRFARRAASLGDRNFWATAGYLGRLRRKAAKTLRQNPLPAGNHDHDAR